MTWQSKNAVAQDGDLVEIVGLRHQHFIIKLKPGEVLHTHRGIVRHDELIGKPWGSQFFSHNGNPFFLLQPGLSDIIRSIPRSTQIMYPKDIGFMLVYMGIGPGRICVEAGTGSGSMTAALAFAVGDTGKVISYEINPDFQNIALKNLQRLGLDDRVILKCRDIRDGFDEKDVDILFLDVQYPYDYLQQVKQTLKPGGFFCSIVPTTNKVVLLLDALKREKFGFIEVCEVLLRYFKSDAEHFRPTDRMVAHTGYLVFARPMIIDSATIPDFSLEKFDLE
jgi:tRNA (adenine57-N1/adenine58-N1)-methyltransferase